MLCYVHEIAHHFNLVVWPQSDTLLWVAHIYWSGGLCHHGLIPICPTPRGKKSSGDEFHPNAPKSHWGLIESPGYTKDGEGETTRSLYTLLALYTPQSDRHSTTPKPKLWVPNKGTYWLRQYHHSHPAIASTSKPLHHQPSACHLHLWRHQKSTGCKGTSGEWEKRMNSGDWYLNFQYLSL